MTLRPPTGLRAIRRSAASAKARSRRTEVASEHLLSALQAALVAYSFTLSHMTCKKCKYEFCWVCMGAELCFSMGGSGWLLIVRYTYIQVPGRNTGRRGTRVIDSTRRRALTPAMRNRKAAPPWRDTCTLVAHDHLQTSRAYFLTRLSDSITTVGPTMNNQPSCRWICTPRLRRKWRKCNLPPR